VAAKADKGTNVTQTPTIPEQAASESQSAASGEGQVFARLAIFAIAVVFVGLIGVVWYHSSWHGSATATALFVVEGNPDFEGTVITIDGSALQSPRRDVISAEASYVCRFSLPAGEYSIRAERGGVLVYEIGLFKINDYQYALLPLAPLGERGGRKK
jgi:hypothetical protein